MWLLSTHRRVSLLLGATVQSVSPVAQSCLTLCNPMDCSAPGLPVHHQLPEFTQTHVHPTVSSSVLPFWSHLQSFPASRVFSNESALCIRWPKYWSFIFRISPSNEYAGLITLDGLVGSPGSPRDSQESSTTPQFKSINSSALSFLYGPT